MVPEPPQSPEPPRDAAGADGPLDHAVLDALFGQSPTGLHVLDHDLRVLRVNTAAQGMWGVDPSVVLGRRWHEIDPSFGEVSERVREVLTTGRPLLDAPWTGRLPSGVGGERTLSVSAFRLGGPDDATLGVAVSVVDVTERRRAQEHVDLMLRAGQRLGSTLEVIRTAAELAEVAAGGFADVVAVEVLESVLRGEAPAPGGLMDQAAVRRAGFATAPDREVDEIFPLGEVRLIRSGTPYAMALGDLRPRLIRRLAENEPWLVRDRARAQRLLDAGVHSLLAVPLTARGVVLGLASYYRMAGAEEFDEADLAVASELASRAAVCVDNARRYTRENTLASLVRRSLVPSRPPRQSAVTAAHTYLPVVSGGSWFDVIPLSSSRVALVVGEVSGHHGVPAATTMGRLRTALGTLAAMDVPPDELFERLHELTGQLADERPTAFADQPPLSATCLLVTYDPVTGRCVLVAAGRPGPLTVVSPDGEPREVAMTAGPPLGRGVAEYAPTRLDLPEGSLLALHNVGLAPTPDARQALLTELGRPASTDLQERCDALVRAVLPQEPNDDALLLLLRTRLLGPDQVASWTLAGEPRSAAAARRAVGRQLTDWGLDGLVPTTELVASELVTNAVRYTVGPIRLRLIRDRGLVCEISDDSSAAPHLRHAEDDDEGGRGLYLVSQLTDRWGARHDDHGKTIWTEQELP